MPREYPFRHRRMFGSNERAFRQLVSHTATDERVNLYGFKDSWPGGTNTPHTAWEHSSQSRVYFPWTGELLEIVSSSASDALIGSGLRKLALDLVDGSGAAVEQTVELNGTTPVPLPGTFIGCNGMTAIEAGATMQAQGLIEVRQQGGGQAVACIGPGATISRGSHYVVPTNCRACATAWHVGMAHHRQASVFSTLWLWRPDYPTVAVQLDRSPWLDEFRMEWSMHFERYGPSAPLVRFECTFETDNTGGDMYTELEILIDRLSSENPYSTEVD